MRLTDRILAEGKFDPAMLREDPRLTVEDSRAILGEFDASTIKDFLLNRFTAQGAIAAFLIARKRDSGKADVLLARDDIKEYLDRKKIGSPNGEARTVAALFGLKLKDARQVTKRYVRITNNGRISLAVALKKK